MLLLNFMDPINFIRGIHLILSLFGGIFLMLIWFHVQKQSKDFAQDWGLILIALALFVWSANDTLKIINDLQAAEPLLQAKWLSTFNNAFIIASLPFFKFGFEGIKKRFDFFRNGKPWVLGVLIANIVLFILLSTFFNSGNTPNIIHYFDFLYSGISFALIGYAITKAFQKRGYGNAFIFMTLLIAFLLIITQLALLPQFSTVGLDFPKLLMICSQLILISLFLLLAQSWVVEANANQLEKQIATRHKNLIDELTKEKTELSATNNQLIEENNELKEIVEEQQQNKTDKLPQSNLILSDADVAKLTPRESEIFEILPQKLSYKEIGENLHIAKDTVISNIRNIENKLGIKGKKNLEEAAGIYFNKK